MAENSELLVLCSIEDEQGSPAYVYLAIKPELVHELERVRQKGALELASFGRIVLTGPGSCPPLEVAECLELAWGEPLPLPSLL